MKGGVPLARSINNGRKGWLSFLGLIELALWATLLFLITSPALGFLSHAPQHTRAAMRVFAG